MNISPQALVATIRLNLMRRPLMCPEAVEEVLDIGRVRLNALIDCGKLPWAWDFSAIGGHSKEVRILSACVVELAAGSPVPAVGATRNLDLAAVINLVIPQKRESLRGIELQRWFHLSADWFHDMRANGELEWIPETLPKTGPKASPRFTRESVSRLLERRRIT